MEPKRITSPRNELIKHYKKLCKSSSERREKGLFVLEGLRVVTDLKGMVCPRILLVTEEALGKYAERLDEDFLRTCGEVIVIDRDIADDIALTETSQQVFAVCDAPVRSSPESYGGEPLVILDMIRDPGNMGTILRTADAMGISVGICGCCDELSPKVVRSAVGSLFRVRLYAGGFEEMIGAVHRKGIRTMAAVISRDAEVLGRVSLDNSAVVIGNEANGIPAEHTALCSGRLTIPMKGSINSLNAAMAAGLIMWELSGRK